ncbi:MAG TPA: cupin domain-containing protein [Conexibacter sp.]|nr:cupin domain-containing protein [Conexibacter sp.]
MSTATSCVVKRFDRPDETRPFASHGKSELLDLGGHVVGRGEFEPGWRWSNDVKPIAGTDVCQVFHLGYCVSGRMRVHMYDGPASDIGPGDAFMIPPGHDAEVIGDEPCVLLEFGQAAEYAKR